MAKTKHISGDPEFEQLIAIQKALMLGQPVPFTGPKIPAIVASIKKDLERYKREGIEADLPRD